MISKEILKISEKQSLIARIKDDGSIYEYVVCSNYDDNAPEGSKWDWGHYFTAIRDALEYIVLDCFGIEEELKEKYEAKANRFATIAHNAIILGELDINYEYDTLLEELGCSEEEYEKIELD
jgi:hypothetical protein